MSIKSIIQFLLVCICASCATRQHTPQKHMKVMYEVNYDYCFLIIDTTQIKGLKAVTDALAAFDFDQLERLVANDMKGIYEKFEETDFLIYMKIRNHNILYDMKLETANNTKLYDVPKEYIKMLKDRFDKKKFESYEICANYFMQEYSFMKLDAVNGGIWHVKPWYVWPDQYLACFLDVIKSNKEKVMPADYLFSYPPKWESTNSGDGYEEYSNFLIPHDLLKEIRRKIKGQSFPDPAMTAHILNLIDIALKKNNAMLLRCG